MKKFYEENPNNQPLKGYDFLDSDLEVASTDEIVCSSEEAPLIGTYNLKNGVAIIIINNENESVLGHFTNDINVSIYSMLNYISLTKPLKVVVIPGTGMLTQSVDSILTFLKNSNNVQLYDFQVEVINLANYDNLEKSGIGFAYDTRTKQYLKPNYSEMLSVGRS